jgi:3-hydroxy-9,10-secoandrosta-1,3,5(10)-triene-9,17-dione monooxygenase reductase component
MSEHSTALAQAPVHEASTAAVTLRHLMREVAQPVVVVTGRDRDRRPWGMTVSSFTSVSLDPPLALFCPSRGSVTWAAIGPLGHFVLNVLTADQEALAARFAQRGAGFPSRVPYRTDHDGLPFLGEAAFTARCTSTAAYAAGDHDIVVAAVGEVRAQCAGRPLSYWRGRYTSVHDVEEASCSR